MQKEKKICPVCATENGAYHISVQDFKIYKCTNCGLEHTHPIPTNDQLNEFYSEYVDMRAAPDVLLLNAKKLLEIMTSLGYSKDHTILDFGAGNGTFVNVAGENCYGIELNKKNSVRVFRSFAELPLEKFHFITLWGVLEHLPDPKQTLQELTKFLRPNGTVIITTVDAESNIPYYYKPIEHLTYWTRSSFDNLFEGTGLELIEYRPHVMYQLAKIYVDRLLSRTPKKYTKAFERTLDFLPKYVEIPTNEVFVVGKKLSL
jgi:SAM-dependent methyltransferase